MSARKPGYTTRCVKERHFLTNNRFHTYADNSPITGYPNLLNLIKLNSFDTHSITTDNSPLTTDP